MSDGRRSLIERFADGVSIGALCLFVVFVVYQGCAR